MKRADIRKANDILDLYMSCAEKIKEQDEISRQGGSEKGDRVDHSGAPPDVTAIKADKQKRIYITTEEHIAYRCVMDIPLTRRNVSRLFVVAHRYNMNRYNPLTKKPVTHEDCAKALGVTFEQYEKERHELLQGIIERFDERIEKYSMYNECRALVNT